MYPGEPLFAVADFASQSEFERGQHFFQCAALFIQHYPDSHNRQAATNGFNAVGGGFPLFAQGGCKVFPRG